MNNTPSPNPLIAHLDATDDEGGVGKEVSTGFPETISHWKGHRVSFTHGVRTIVSEGGSCLFDLLTYTKNTFSNAAKRVIRHAGTKDGTGAF